MTIRRSIVATLVIAAKDLTQRLRDRSAIIIAVFVPFGLAFILNATIGGASEGGFTFEFAVANNDNGPIGEAFMGVLDEMERDGVASITTVASAGDVAELIDDDAISAGFVLPEGLSQAVTTGAGSTIEVRTNPEREVSSDVASAIAGGFASEVNAVQVSVLAAAGPDLQPGDVLELATAAAERPSPIVVRTSSIGEGGFDFATFYAVGIAVFFVFFTVQFGVLSLIHEREDGTMPRLIAAPIPVASIVAGKVAAAFVLGLASMVVLWLATSLVMGAEWGYPIGVLALIIAGVVAAMGVTALVATLAKTAEQAGGWTTMIAVVLGILGGTFFPVAQAAGFLSWLSWATPHRWLMDGFLDLSGGAGLAEILPAAGAVFTFGIVTGAIGLARSRRLVTMR